MNTGSKVRPVSALDTNHSVHARQYLGDVSCSRTLVAPIVAATAGATRTAGTTNIRSAGMLSRRGSPRNSHCRSSAATSARTVFARSASSTQERLHCDRLARA